MKKYIFLGQSILGNGGGQIYLLNKKVFLELLGYEVSIYSFHTDGEIFYTDFNEYKNLIFPEFQFGLGYFKKKYIQETIQKVISLIDKSKYDEIIIESNWIGSAEWGELIASMLCAKHVIYLLSEHNNPEESTDFLYFKHKRQEISAISETVIKEVFSNNTNFSLNNYSVISAGCFSLSYPQNINSSEIDSAFDKKADYTISYFGRFEKLKIRYIEEVQKLAKKYPDYNFLLVAMGYNAYTEINKYGTVAMNSPTNLNIKFIKSQISIPESFFKKSDVIIASAGCAVVAAINNILTISMDVNTEEPIGILGITTKESTFSKTKIEKSLCEILEDVLIKEHYNIKDIDMNHIKLIHIKARQKFLNYISLPNDKTYYIFNKPRRKFKLNKSEIRRLIIRFIGIKNIILYRNFRYK